MPLIIFTLFADTKPFAKKANLITTDSLAGIRERLKRLSDESLYKEDMVVTPENPDTSLQVLNTLFYLTL